MNEWYYARGGQQHGPVAWERLQELARTGELDAKDLAWNASMPDWVPAGEVPDLFLAPDAPSSERDPANPYAAPVSSWSGAPAVDAVAWEEIVPGSDPLSATACVKRGFQLTARHFSLIFLVGLAYVGVSLVAETVLSLMDLAFGWGHRMEAWNVASEEYGMELHGAAMSSSSIPHLVISYAISLFLTLGTIRIGLNLVSGKECSVGMLFGQAPQFLRALGATFLYSAMVLLGTLLLVAPGVYLAIRYSQYLNAIVDKNLGVFASFSYSSRITEGNRWNLLWLYLLCLAVTLAGLLALCVGLIFALPATWIAWMAAYRWLQYGRRAVQDEAGSILPAPAGPPGT